MGVYEIIKSKIGLDGKLPPMFSLENIGENGEVSCAAGMMDGVALYHMHPPNDDECFDAAKLVTASLIAYFEPDGGDEELKVAESILAEYRAVHLIDSAIDVMQQYLELLVKEHDAEYSFSVFRYWLNSCIELIKTSENMEIVKLCMTLIGGLGLANLDDSVELLVELAVYDGLTLYALAAISALEPHVDSNAIIFQIAQKVHGWGSVHASNYLEPADDRIRDWFLRDACRNSYMQEYIALTCAEMGDLISALRRETLDKGLLDGIAIIMETTNEGGPVAGINYYEYAEEAKALFLRHSNKA